MSPRDSRVGVIEYSDNANVIFHLNKYQNIKDVKEAVENIQPSRGIGLSTDEVLKTAAKEMFTVKNGAQPGLPKVFVLFTSAKSTGSQPLRDMGKSLKELGVTIYVVGIGGKVDRDELTGLVPGRRDKLISVTDPYQIRLIIWNIITPILNRVPKRKFKHW